MDWITVGKYVDIQLFCSRLFKMKLIIITSTTVMKTPL